jgi:hypothetical protein
MHIVLISSCSQNTGDIAPLNYNTQGPTLESSVIDQSLKHSCGINSGVLFPYENRIFLILGYADDVISSHAVNQGFSSHDRHT